jgi:hypothetical protein
MICDIKPQILTPGRKMLPLVFFFLGWVAPAVSKSIIHCHAVKKCMF